jgi:hypothetical protein
MKHWQGNTNSGPLFLGNITAKADGDFCVIPYDDFCDFFLVLKCLKTEDLGLKHTQ